MKVVSARQMADLERGAYSDGASESDFMEEAGSGIALVVHDFAEKRDIERRVILLCGKGNNGGDAFVAAIHLMHLEYEVIAYQLFPGDESSYLCAQSRFRFMAEGGQVIEVLTPDSIVLPQSGIIVDGIFGTGFRGEVDPFVKSIIHKANSSKLPIIAIDIPSGLHGDTGEVCGAAMVAHTTAYLGLPKLGFFLNDGWNHVGKLIHVDFGLAQKYIDNVPTLLEMLESDMMRALLPPLVRNRHKYEAGYVVGLAGSPSMPGAAILGGLSALRSGAGIVRLLHPKGMEIELAASPYELLKREYDLQDIPEIIESMNRANSTFIGPGLGVTDQMRALLGTILPQLVRPCVIDADALTILAEEEIALPNSAIFTPHKGELKRLLHVTEAPLTMEFLEQCNQYAVRKKVVLILKGGPSFIFRPGQPILVNPKGDPGMATAGSGDVLTGLLASLLAQGVSAPDAAALGVYLHGLAGEFAADELTSYCVNASDLFSYFPDAFSYLGA